MKKHKPVFRVNTPLRILQDMRNDPRVESVHDDRRTGDGIVVVLKKGWAGPQGDETVIEHTIPNLQEAMTKVFPAKNNDSL